MPALSIDRYFCYGFYIGTPDTALDIGLSAYPLYKCTKVAVFFLRPVWHKFMGYPDIHYNYLGDRTAPGSLPKNRGSNIAYLADVTFGYSGCTRTYPVVDTFNNRICNPVVFQQLGAAEISC